MLTETVTHYFPWDANDIFATCGHRMGAQDVHATQPTCPACAAHLAALDAAIDDTPLALDAAEARTDLSPADALFAWAVDLTRSYAATLVPALSTLAEHKDGACDHGCGFCAELTARHRELVALFGARRPDLDRIEDIEDRLRELGNSDWFTFAQRDAEAADDAARDAAYEVGR